MARLDCSGKGVLYGRARLCEPVGTVFCHVDAVFLPDTELAADADHRFIAKAQPGREGRCVASDNIVPLMNLEADAMAGAVRQAWQAISGAKAGALDHPARRRVDRLHRSAKLRSSKSRILSPSFDLPNVKHALRGLAKYERTADVRVVAIDRARAIHNDHIAFT